MNTLSGPVLYTNLLGWPPMLAFAAMGGEYQRLMNDISTRIMNGEEHLLPPTGLFLLSIGCIVGTGIGYSGWFCRSRVSAASYTLIGVINKCLTVLVNLLVSFFIMSCFLLSSLFSFCSAASFFCPCRLSDLGSTRIDKWYSESVTLFGGWSTLQTSPHEEGGT